MTSFFSAHYSPHRARRRFTGHAPLTQQRKSCQNALLFFSLSPHLFTRESIIGIEFLSCLSVKFSFSLFEYMVISLLWDETAPTGRLKTSPSPTAPWFTHTFTETIQNKTFFQRFILLFKFWKALSNLSPTLSSFWGWFYRKYVSRLNGSGGRVFFLFALSRFSLLTIF